MTCDCIECEPNLESPVLNIHGIGENPTTPPSPMSDMFELTVALFTMPAVGSTTYLTVVDSSAYTVGMSVYIVGAGWLYVNAIANATALELQNKGAFQNSDPATEVAIGAAVIPSRPQFTNTLFGSVVWDPASVADGDAVSQEVTVTGAALGDFAIASFSLDVQDLVLDAQVTAANTVTVVLANNTGGAINLASGTVRVIVLEI